MVDQELKTQTEVMGTLRGDIEGLGRGLSSQIEENRKDSLRLSSVAAPETSREAVRALAPLMSTLTKCMASKDTWESLGFDYTQSQHILELESKVQGLECAVDAFKGEQSEVEDMRDRLFGLTQQARACKAAVDQVAVVLPQVAAGLRQGSADPSRQAARARLSDMAHLVAGASEQIGDFVACFAPRNAPTNTAPVSDFDGDFEALEGAQMESSQEHAA